MSNYNNERTVFSTLLNMSNQELFNSFKCVIDGDVVTFTSHQNDEYYITVNRHREPFLARVNADFNFGRPAGSNNYPEMNQVADKLLAAFHISGF